MVACIVDHTSVGGGNVGTVFGCIYTILGGNGKDDCNLGSCSVGHLADVLTKVRSHCVSATRLLRELDIVRRRVQYERFNVMREAVFHTDRAMPTCCIGDHTRVSGGNVSTVI